MKKKIVWELRGGQQFESFEDAKARYAQRIEILEEQIYFARTLLESLEERLKQCTSVKQARDAFRTECANSMFER